MGEPKTYQHTGGKKDRKNIAILASEDNKTVFTPFENKTGSTSEVFKCHPVHISDVSCCGADNCPGG